METVNLLAILDVLGAAINSSKENQNNLIKVLQEVQKKMEANEKELKSNVKKQN